MTSTHHANAAETMAHREVDFRYMTVPILSIVLSLIVCVLVILVKRTIQMLLRGTGLMMCYSLLAHWQGRRRKQWGGAAEASERVLGEGWCLRLVGDE